MRALFLMWLLCSAWMVGLWWFSRSALTPELIGTTAATAHAGMLILALCGGVVFTLFLALYLSLSIKIDQSRLRIAAQALMRGAAPPVTDVAPEWRGLLDDLRVVSRRQLQELAETSKQLQAREHDLAIAQARTLAVDAVVDQMFQAIHITHAELEQILVGMPLQGVVQMDCQARAQSSLELLRVGLNASVTSLEAALQPVSALFKAAEMSHASRSERHEARTHAAEQRRVFVQTVTQLAESMQLLGLNFSLILERMRTERDENPEFALMFQDLGLLCAEAAVLQDQVRVAEHAWFEPGPDSKADEAQAWPLPGLQTRQVLAAFLPQAARDLQTMTAALQHTQTEREGESSEWVHSDDSQDALRTAARAMSQRLTLVLRQVQMQFASPEGGTPAPDTVVPRSFQPVASSRHSDARGGG